jgi:hypothetical protein
MAMGIRTTVRATLMAFDEPTNRYAMKKSEYQLNNDRFKHEKYADSA